MKKFLCMTMLPALILCGCGGGSKPNLKENEILGKFPSIFVESHKEKAKILDDMRAETQSAKTPENMIKIHDKYVALGKEAEQRTLQTAEAELERILDRSVPFEMAYEDPDFEIRSAIVDGGEPSTGALTVTLVIAAKKNMVASTDSQIKYQILGTDGGVLFGGSINPFLTNQVAISSRSFPHGMKVAAGEECTRQGSWLMLYCGSYDFTDFGKIVFVK